jgi:hypothetical protein
VLQCTLSISANCEDYCYNFHLFCIIFIVLYFHIILCFACFIRESLKICMKTMDTCSMCCLQLLVLLVLLVMVWCIQLHLLQVALQVHWLPSRALWPLHSLQLPQVHWYPLHKRQVLLDQAPSLEQTVCHLVETRRLCSLLHLVAVSSRVLLLHQYHHIFNRMALLTQVCLLMTSYSVMLTFCGLILDGR